jgi:lysophospholipase L1-like esterase
MSSTLSAATPPAARPRRLRWRDLRRSVKVCVLLFVGLVFAGILELGSRVYWKTVKGVAPVRAEAIFRSFYDELDEQHIDAVAPYHGDDSFDVLILGGSVVHKLFGDIGERIGAGLEQKLGRKVRVVNLANLGHTTRDSLNKYARLKDKRFDLVIVYHGINDVRLNNTPPGAFKADYSHHTRFAQIAAIDRHKELPYLTFPYTAYYLTSSLLDRWHMTNRPRPEFIHYGKDIRTPPCFEANMEMIAAIAKERSDRLALLTYALHVPANYTEAAFKAKQLGYTTPSNMSLESGWGEPANVIKAVDLHIEGTRRVAGRHPEVILIEQAKLMPGDGKYFVDPCHLSKDGCKLFAENVLANLDAAHLGTAVPGRAH